MSLIAKGTSFTPPPEGVWSAVCVDVVDLGMVDSQWGSKHKCRLVWEISERMEDGRPFLASKQYSVSLHEKASLHKDLKSWRGKAFTAEELKGWDLERVIGAPCQLVITHEEKDGMVYGNITAVMKSSKKQTITPSGKYVRVKDRAENGKKTEVEPIDDDDANDYPGGDTIPF
jgi:hypothetical protein